MGEEVEERQVMTFRYRVKDKHASRLRAAVAFSKTAKGRQIAAELNGPSKDTRS